MDTLVLYFGIALTALAASTILGLIGLRAFNAWIDLKRSEITRTDSAPSSPTIGQRIDVADLRERVRRLEAIAAGVDI
jgi:hypothetical protein